jgi:nitrate reductase delta subunit
MRQLFKKATEDTDPLERVKEWTRERFKLAGDAPVLVAEITCGLPGCPPLETVVVFWTEGDGRHQFKLFKPVSAIVAEDLPPAWMKNALIALNGMGLECC